MRIICTGCEQDVDARLTNGKEMYPNRLDLAAMPFYVCDTCGAFVGTHWKTKTRQYEPLGFLATPEIKRMRKQIHELLDPMWKTRKIKRGQAYAYVSNRIGRTYHTGAIYSMDDAKQIYAIVKELRDRVYPGPWNR